MLWPVSLRAAELANAAAAGRQINFGRDIQPILARRCFACHGPDKAEAGLAAERPRRRSGRARFGRPRRRARQAGRKRTAAPDRLDRRRRADAARATSRSPAEQVALIRQWIAEGAAWRGHWAFEPVGAACAAGREARSDWVKARSTPSFSAGWNRRGLSPAPPAEKIALLRRADLRSDRACRRRRPRSTPFWPTRRPRPLPGWSIGCSLRRVMANAGRGIGSTWCAIADTNSFERDGAKPHAWRYRDYVIRSLNDDKPYDQFIREQMAGDELPQVHRRLDHRHRLLSPGHLGRRAGRPRAGQIRRAGRHRDHHRPGDPGADGQLCPLPRSQDRSDCRSATITGWWRSSTALRPMATQGPAIEDQMFVETPASRAGVHDAGSMAVRASSERSSGDRPDSSDAAGPLSREPTARPRRRDLSRRSGGPRVSLLSRHVRRLPEFDMIKPETVGKLTGLLFDLSPATRETAFGFVFTGMLKVPRDGEYTFTLDSDDGSRLRSTARWSLEYDGIHGAGQSAARRPLICKPGRLPIGLEYFQREGRLWAAARLVGAGLRTPAAGQKRRQPRAAGRSGGARCQRRRAAARPGGSRPTLRDRAQAGAR